MDRDMVTELHYIAPIANLPSMARWGLIRHNLAAKVQHASVALGSVQDRRAGRRLPWGVQLHDYVNLYFDARNPMMSYLRHRGCAPIVVLRIDQSVLDIDGAIIADGNAAAYYTRFYPSPAGLANLDDRFVYARGWPDPNEIRELENKRRRCAELLIPNHLPVEFIKSAYFCDVAGRDACTNLNIPGEVNTDVFFR
jgi:hypothetical protein